MNTNTVREYDHYVPESKVNIVVKCDARALVVMAMAAAGIKYNGMTDKKDRTDGDILVVETQETKEGKVKLSYSISNLAKEQFDWDSGLQKELSRCAKYHKCTVEQLTEELTEIVREEYVTECGGRPA